MFKLRITEVLLQVLAPRLQVSPTLVRPSNLSTHLSKHKRATINGDVNNHIVEHHIESTGTLWHALCILQTTINDSL